MSCIEVASPWRSANDGGPASGPKPRAGDASANESDAELLQRVGAGDLTPLGVLYDRHHDGVRQFVARATAGGADTDDILQETFITLVGVAPRYDGRASARPLLLGIAAQLVRQHRRGMARFVQVLQSFASGSPERGVRTPEDAASATEELTRFEQALARLPEEKRLVVLLVEREGLSGEEAAEALQIPLNTVWTRLHYARAELRKALELPRAGGPRSGSPAMLTGRAGGMGHSPTGRGPVLRRAHR